LDLCHTLNALLDSSIEPLHREDRAGDIRNSLADISKAKQYFNYDPTVRFKEGLKITIQHEV
jgi:nucleoside-diphosphate-sugar epimerase